MAINPLIALSLQSPSIPFVDLGGIRDRSRANEQAAKLNELKISQAESQAGEFEANADLRKLQGLSERDQLRTQSLVRAAAQLSPMIESGDLNRAAAFLDERERQLIDLGIDASDTQELKQLLATNPDAFKREIEAGLAIGQKFGLLPGAAETFEPVLDESGNIVGQRSSATGKVVADPRARESKLMTPEELQQQIDIAKAKGQVDVANQLLVTQRKQQLEESSPRGQLETQKLQSEVDASQAKAEQERQKVADAAKQREEGAQLQRDALDIVNSLLSPERRGALNAASGPIDSRLPTAIPETVDVEVDVNRLRAILTKDNLGLLKGVLSDTDIRLLGDIAAGGLNLRGSDEALVSELERIQKKLQGATVSTPIPDDEPVFAVNPDTGERIMWDGAKWVPAP